MSVLFEKSLLRPALFDLWAFLQRAKLRFTNPKAAQSMTRFGLVDAFNAP